MPARNVVAAGAALVVALAGGIALGAGVLGGADSEPAAASGRPQATDTPQDLAAREVADAYREQLGATPLADRLAGKTVTVVALPGASDATLKTVSTSLASAGATVVGSVRLTARLLDPADRQFSTGVAEQTLKGVTDTPTTDLANYELVGAALGRALAATEPVAIDAPAQNILAALTEAKLVEQVQAPTHRAPLTVVVTGDDEDYSSGRGELVATLASRIDAAGTGTVVAGPVGSGAPGGAVEAIRDSDAAESVSSVDVLGVPFGDLALVATLQREAAGTAGQYGTSGAADGELPPLS